MASRAKRVSNAKSVKWATLFTFALGAVVACIFSAPRLHAQAVSGDIVGNISDRTGAQIPQASVVITEEQTGETRRIMSDSNGYYSSPYLKPGLYKVSVSKEGFATVVRSAVTVPVNTTVRVDVTLELGTVTQSLTVRSNMPLLQTDSARTGATVFPSTQAEALPLSVNRNFQNLLNYVPGTTRATFQHSRFFNVQGSLTTDVNGTNSLNGNTRIDGISNNERTGLLQVYIPPIEAIQEVHVVTSNYDAEQGNALGAVTNAILKSGTNEFHGAVYEFWKGDKLVARSFFQRGPQGTPFVKPRFVYNQFGGNIGGPIRKGKTFFFFDYQRISDSEGQFQTLSVPTAAMRGGNFSDPALTKIFDPATGNPDGTGRSPFPGNVIPGNRIDPISAKLLSLVPLPNNNLNAPGRQKFINNFLETTGFTQIVPSFDLKVDQHQTERDHITGVLSHMFPTTVQSPAYGFAGGPVFGSFEGSGTDSTWLGSVAWDHIFSPTLLAQTRISFTRYHNLAQPSDFGKNDADALGIPGANLNLFTSGIPRIQGEGFSDPMIGYCSCLPWNRAETQFEYVSNWSKIVGNHTFKWGGSAFRIRDDLLSTNVLGPRGTFQFGPGTTALNGGPGTGFANNFASFLLGVPSLVGRDLPIGFPTYRAWQYALYVNDKWQVDPKITLNLGLRWEDYPAATPRSSGGFSQYNPNTNELVLAGIGGNPLNLGMQSRPHDFAPRLGVAYRLSPQTVLRGGFGMSYAPFEDNSYAYNFPVFQLNQFTNQGNTFGPSILPDGTAASFEKGFPPPIVASIPSNGVIPVNTPALQAQSFKVVNKNYLDPYIESWNLTFEHALPGQWVLDVGYVGNHGVHIPMQFDLNASVIPGAGKLGQPLFTRFGRTSSTTLFFAAFPSSYNSLQVSLNHRFAGGFSVTTAYTYGKALGYGGECGENSCSLQYYVDLVRNYARTDFDRRHSFVATYVWDLPFGKGHRLSRAGVPNAILGAWRLSGNTTFMTGLPLNFGCACPSNTPGNGNAPNINGPFQVLSGVDTKLWFNTSVFSQPPAGVLGNLGRFVFAGPNFFNLDASLERQFRLTERFNLEFRTEWFNATNTPQFNNPGLVFGSSSFGRITSTRGGIQQDSGGNRIIDFALKLTF